MPNELLFQGALASIMFLLGVVQWMMSSRQKEQLGWMRQLSQEQKEQGITLVRIDARMEGLRDLKEKQEHDHAQIRALDKEVNEVKMKVHQLEVSMKTVIGFCNRNHGESLRHLDKEGE